MHGCSCCSPELLGEAAVTLLLNLMLLGGSWAARAFSKLGRETPRVSFTPPAATAAFPQALRSKAFSRRPSQLTNSILGVLAGARVTTCHTLHCAWWLTAAEASGCSCENELPNHVHS